MVMGFTVPRLGFPIRIMNLIIQTGIMADITMDMATGIIPILQADIIEGLAITEKIFTSKFNLLSLRN